MNWLWCTGNGRLKLVEINNIIICIYTTNKWTVQTWASVTDTNLFIFILNRYSSNFATPKNLYLKNIQNQFISLLFE